MSKIPDDCMEIRVTKLDSEVLKFFANPANHYKILSVVWHDTEGRFYVVIKRTIEED